MKIDLSAIRTIGSGLVRPEGVVAADDGTIYAADGRGCCARIGRKGETAFWGRLGGLPNGLCLDREGHCLEANIGNGRLQRLSPRGEAEVLMIEAGGRRMPAPNFPLVDSRNRIWVSNSTSRDNLSDALQGEIPDGSVVLIRDGNPRIAAEGICFANGLALDAGEENLYVAETMKRRILRFAVAGDGTLSAPEVYGPDCLGKFAFPDGIAFDEAGNLWITFPMANSVGYLTPRRELAIALEDPEGVVLRRPSNICFGWEGRKTAFLGSLEGSNLPYFEAPFPGLRLIHQRG